MINMESKILVFYIGVAGIRSEDISNYIHKVTERIIPTTIEGEIIIIPIQSHETKVECINPKYITDIELINEHTEMMKKLQKELQYQSEQLRNNNNE
jgi:hypothetical protein